MATIELDFTGLPNANPYPPPVGSGFTSRRSAAQITSGAWLCTTDAVWSYDSVISNDNFSISCQLGTVNENARGVVVFNASGNGFLFLCNNANVRVFAMAAWALTGSAISTYTTTFVLDDVLNVDVTQSTGTYVVKNGSTTIGTFVNTTYTSGLGSGLTSRNGGSIKKFSISFVDSRTIDSITDPIIFGEPLTIETTGFTDPTSITAAGMTAVIDSFEDEVIEATWPELDEGLVCTVPLPATSVELTVSESGGSASVNVDFPLTNEYPEFVEFDNINTGGRYIGGKITLEEGWRSYYDNTQLGGMEILPDSSVTCTDAGTFTMLLHRIGDDNDMVKYFVTVNEHGDVTNVKGLTVSGVSVKGLSMKGLAVKGL